MTTTEPSTMPSARPTRRGDGAWRIAAGVAAALLVGFIVYVATRPSHPKAQAFPVTPPPALALGSQAPGFTLPRLGGGPDVVLSATAGTPTIVNFFASWCRDCAQELGAFGALFHTTAGAVAIVGVDSNDTDVGKAQALLAGAGATYPVGVDGNAAVASSYRLVALPVTYYLDAHGRVVHVGFGAQSPAALEHWAGILHGTKASS